MNCLLTQAESIDFRIQAYSIRLNACLLLQDLLASLRPSLERISTFDDAMRAVGAIEANEARSAAIGPASLGIIEEEDSESDNSNGSESDNENEGKNYLFRATNSLMCL